MKWPLPVLLLAALLAGCYGPSQTMDPFLGRTTVPPPGTGQILAPGAAQPYYQGSPLPGGPTSVTPVPGSAMKPVGALNRPSSYQPSESLQRLVETPGEREYRVGRSAMEKSEMERGSPELRSVNGIVHLEGELRADQVRTVAAEGDGSQIDWQSGPTNASVTKIAEPQVRIPREVAKTTSKSVDKSRAVASSFQHQRVSASLADVGQPRVPARFRPPNHAVDIAKLPPATKRRPGRAKVTTSGFVDRTSSPRVAFPSSAKVSPRSGARYAFAPDYSWLKGKLEYLHGNQQWKLRYIPIDGETDEFGGSVVIADVATLGNYKAGNFVKVEGAVALSLSRAAQVTARHRRPRSLGATRPSRAR